MAGLLALILFAAALVVLVLTIVVVHDATHPVRRTGAYAAVRGLPFDPGDLGFAFDAWTLERPGGVTLPVWELALEENRDSSRTLTIVLIHGWGESRIDMLSWISAVRAHAGRIALYDLRGHGEAAGPSRLGNGEDDDLIALLEQLPGEGPLVLIGRDLGANLALSAAAKESHLRHRISGVVAIRAYDDFHAKWRDRLTSRELPARPMIDLGMAWLSLTGRRPLTISASQLNLRCPVLCLDDEDQAAVDAFLQQAAASAG